MTKDKRKSSEQDGKDDITEKKDKEHYIYAKVPDHTREIIDKLKEEGKTISYIIQSALDIYEIYHSTPREIKDFVEEYQQEFGSQKELVYEALKRLEVRYHREKAEDDMLWERAKDEMNVILVGKKFITYLINEAETAGFKLDKSQIRILAIDPIIWITGKPLKSLALEEFLNAIKKIWTVFKYFNLIDIKKENEKQFYLLFNHRQNINYSKFWLRILKELFIMEDFSFNCSVDGEAYEETLSIIIKKE